MKTLKFDLEIPFWCSFGDFGSLNIKLTYPFPPPAAIFGLIQNAMNLPALHTLLSNEDTKTTQKIYIDNFNYLKFAIILNNNPEKIEDFSNIHKGSRESENIESELDAILKDFLKNSNLTEENKKEIKTNKLKLKRFNEYISKNEFLEKDKEEFDKIIAIIEKLDCEEILNIIKKYWQENSKGINGFNLNKAWISTQIHRQKLINPNYTIYLSSNVGEGLWSLEHIYNILKNPKRPLYIGESDDVVNVLNLEIVELDKNERYCSEIHSIIPGIYENSELIKIPIKLKYDINNPTNHYKICSIPKGNINESIESYSYNGENIVFL